MSVEPVAGSGNTSSYAIQFTQSNNSLSTFPYGTQPPVLQGPQVLNLVTDSEDSQFGPAWFFQAPYNKLVILPESAITPLPISKRDGSVTIDTDLKQKGVAQAGEKPWFCYWNNTLLETFVYSNTTSNAGAQEEAASASAASAATATQTTPPPSTLTPRPTPYTSAVVARSAFPPSLSTSTALSSSSTIPLSTIPSLYPKVVKIEERRMPLLATPYCVQMLISPDGMHASPNLVNGQSTILSLNETEAAFSPSKRDGLTELVERELKLAQRQSTSSCSCAWRMT